MHPGLLKRKLWLPQNPSDISFGHRSIWSQEIVLQVLWDWLTALRIKSTGQTKTSKSCLIYSDLKQTGKQRRTVFQYEILPYSPLPFPLINHFNQIKCQVVFRLVLFVLLFQNISVNILVKHSPLGNSKQTILAFSQKCLLLTNHLLTWFTIRFWLT